MEAEGSSPHLQVRATCPYPEQATIQFMHPNSLPEDPSSYYPPIYAWVFQVFTFPVFLTKTLYTPLPHTRYMPHPSNYSRYYNPKNIW